ncbi:MAG: M48 family metallopeptidase [Chitinophagaceae bacterium]|nr:M48 family metallopeptidase [Chitinophagaceae bacterium]
MRNKILIACLSSAMIAVGCSRNAITGKNQLSLVSESEMQNMAKTQYRQFLSENKVVSSSNNRDAEMVRRVGTRISNAITKYYTAQGKGSELAGYQWEYNLVDNPQANAWCMPGGKIVVYTGLFPITQNEAALAVVMGHEIAHALAKHGSERMSEGLLQQFGQVALAVAVSNKPAETQNLFLNAYGIGTQVGFALPHSRNQESEADKFGLRFTAMAGYNPREAISLWERMKMASNGNRPPEFLSTHPGEDRRIADLNAIMDETIKDYYRPLR